MSDAGGVDTSTLTLQIIFLAFVIFPEVQKKAQEEIDRVVGTERLPTLQEYVLQLVSWPVGYILKCVFV
jgi:hypothetical protein